MKRILVTLLFSLSVLSQAATFQGMAGGYPSSTLQVAERATGADLLNCMCATQINRGGYMSPECANFATTFTNANAAAGSTATTMAPNPNAASH